VVSRDAANHRRRMRGDIMSRPFRLLAVLALGVALATATSAAVIATPPRTTTTEDQDGRRPLNPLVEEAHRSRPVVELFRSRERNFASDPDIIGNVAAPRQVQPVPDRPVPIVPQPRVGVVASLLLGLVGGVVGGCATLAGWTAATRRRPRQPASAT
jgi:uncharacterized membrane protein YedE/YeeE